ncbi:DoxX family protein [Lacibacterium aquatile]|uniref:DoxX family protein n=1 Tax=Lacibacterium aquatile TaxID=1168082 RepID=A0ABW5DZJ6_9PROT
MNALLTYAPAFGRLLIAVLFILGGFGKIGAYEGTVGYIASVGLPFPALGYVIALIVELGGGILLLVGFQTRITALILAGFSVATALFFHNQLSDQNQMIHFLKNIAVAGGLLQVVAFGAGALSVDNRNK